VDGGKVMGFWLATYAGYAKERLCIGMNKIQKIVLTVVAIVIILMLTFPPFCTETQKRTFNMGYSFILDPPRASMVNTGLLLVQWIGVLLLGGLAWLLVKDTATSTTKSRKVDIDRTFNPASPRPWNRFWARSIDYTLFLVVFYILVVCLALQELSLTFSDNILVETLVWFVISDALLVLYEAAWISASGTTPGKALFSIKLLTNEGNNLSFKQALRRAFSVLASGFAFLVLFPVIPMIAMWGSYKEIKNTGIAKWDKIEGYQLIHKPVGNIRLWLGVILGVVSVIMLSSVHIIMRQINKEQLKEQLRQEYLVPKKSGALLPGYNPDEWEDITPGSDKPEANYNGQKITMYEDLLQAIKARRATRDDYDPDNPFPLPVMVKPEDKNNKPHK
jgi:uncharacterized RDD family membrane protein YckC